MRNRTSLPLAFSAAAALAALFAAAPGCSSSSTTDTTTPDGGGPPPADGAAPHDGYVGPGQDGNTPHPDGSPTQDGNTPHDSGNTGGDSGATHGIKTVFTILLENHDYNEIVGNTGSAPHINDLINQYGLATNYMDSATHPSLPNYLYLVSGATQYPGFVDLTPTTFPFPVAADNLGNQMTGAGVSWRAYGEDEGGNCVLSDTGNYATKHLPFFYFQDIQNNATLCQQTNVDYVASFATDLAAGTYKYMWITPNLLDDGHDPSSTAQDIQTALTQSDTWVQNEVVNKIMTSQAYLNGGAIFITWDEAEGRNGDSADQVPMIVISPMIKSAGYKSNTALSHASYLKTMEELYGVPLLGAAATPTTADLFEFFQ
jgi:acid phosphatase